MNEIAITVGPDRYKLDADDPRDALMLADLIDDRCPRFAFAASYLRERGGIETALRLINAYVQAGNEAWTFERAHASKGYDPGIARQRLHTGVYLVIVSHKAPTKNGFRYYDGSPILYYRKSTTGKYGRTVRQDRVVPAFVDYSVMAS